MDCTVGIFLEVMKYWYYFELSIETAGVWDGCLSFLNFVAGAQTKETDYIPTHKLWLLRSVVVCGDNELGDSEQDNHGT
jgi:nicotinamide riboside transporter PnuC